MKRAAVWGMCLSLALLCVFECRGSGASPEPDDRIARLEALVKERRVLRQQLQEERRRWDDEKQALEMLVAQRTARQRDMEARTTALQESVDALGAQLKDRQTKARVLAQRAGRIRDWLREAGERVAGRLEQRPLLQDDELSVRAEANDGDAAALGDAAARFWNVLLRYAARALATRIEAREVSFPDGSREVRVLFFGGAGAVFLTHDETRCGFAEVRDGRLVWKQLSIEYLESIRRAFRVVENELPAEVLFVPFPRTVVVDGGVR